MAIFIMVTILIIIGLISVYMDVVKSDQQYEEHQQYIKSENDKLYKDLDKVSNRSGKL